MFVFTRVLLPGVLALTCLVATPACAGWLDTVQQAGEQTGLLERSAAESLSRSEIVQGLKAALDKGVDNAVDFLGRPGGYLDHKAVRIPVPDELATAASLARAAGQGERVDAFVASMNRAAEKAVPEAVEVFTAAISQMSFADARKILDGPDDAATKYFRRTSETELTERFAPIVDQATDAVGVTRAYKNLTSALGPGAAAAESFAPDLNAYVTDKALDGLFHKIAQEEKKIRENPAARTSELLKKVFGATNG